MKRVFYPLLLLAVLCCAACSSPASDKEDALSLWNSCEALTALHDYVAAVTDPASPDFIPPEDRIATFDMDGTFLGELCPTYFEYNMLEYRALEDVTYRDTAPADVRAAALAIRAFVRDSVPLPDHFDLIHAHAAAKAYAGMTLQAFADYVTAFGRTPVNGFEGMTYGESFYQPMLQLFAFLAQHGFTCYVVSGSDRYLCRALVRPLGIAPERVIGMDVQLCSSRQGGVAAVDYTMEPDESVLRTDELLVKNLKTNKVLSILREIGKVPVLSFGNSGGDCAMHNLCLMSPYRSAAFMLVADDAERDYADTAKAQELSARWLQSGYHVISMRAAFRTIYAPAVHKTAFTFN